MAARFVWTVGVFTLLLSALDSEALSQSRDTPMTVFNVTGRVLEEDGQPPKDLVQVDLVCNGRIRKQVLTAMDGTFAFDLEPSTDDAWLDPASGGSAKGSTVGFSRVATPGRSANLDEIPSMGRGRVSMSGCEVKVSPQAGITSNVIGLATRESFGDPDIGVLVIRRLAEGVTTVSLNTLNAPKKARDAFDKANEELASKKPNLGKALKQLNRAVQEYPEFSAAWDMMARTQLGNGDAENGRKSFLRAVEAEPKFIPPYLGLAQLAVQQNNWPDATEWTTKVLELDGSQTQALYWSGVAAFYTNDFDKSEEALSSVYERGLAETYPFGLLPLGVIHANRGKLQEAAEEFSLYLKLMPSDQVQEAQRSELQKQISSWESEGLVSLPEEK